MVSCLLAVDSLFFGSTDFSSKPQFLHPPKLQIAFVSVQKKRSKFIAQAREFVGQDMGVGVLGELVEAIKWSIASKTQLHIPHPPEGFPSSSGRTKAVFLDQSNAPLQLELLLAPKSQDPGESARTNPSPLLGDLLPEFVGSGCVGPSTPGAHFLLSIPF